MSNKSQIRIWNNAQRIIAEHKRINKFDLIDTLGISLSTYEKQSAFWKYRFSEFVEYDKKTAEWIYKLEEPEIAETPLEIPYVQISEDWRSEL
ncbi:MAG: hypothetical protein ACREA8_08275 [Nitrosotalea sp.]